MHNEEAVRFQQGATLAVEDARPLIGLDIAKDVFQFHSIHPTTKVVTRLQLSRKELLPYFTKLPPSTVAMEACGGAHHWAREFKSMGHHVKLLPAFRVSPFVVGDKTDSNDAQAIFVAAQQAHIVAVPVKDTDMQALVALHRLRAQSIRMRIMTTNAMRGLLSEFGHVFPITHTAFFKRLNLLLAADEHDLPDSVVISTKIQMRRVDALQADISEMDKKLKAHVRDSPMGRALLSIPGVGPLGASIYLTLDMGQFPDARAFASWIGLSPKQSGTGGRITQSSMKKRGDSYIRNLVMQGAISVIVSSPRSQSPWLKSLRDRRPMGVVRGALAAKIARTVYAVLKTGQPFERTSWALESFKKC